MLLIVTVWFKTTVSRSTFGGGGAGHDNTGQGSMIGHGCLCGGHMGQVTFYFSMTMTSLMTGGGVGQVTSSKVHFFTGHETSSRVHFFSGFSGGHYFLGIASSSLPPSRV